MRKNHLKEEVISSSLEETHRWGFDYSKRLKSGDIVAFFGDLGAGKTTLIKAICSGLTGCSLDEISSPTFSYLHIYKGDVEVYHFDLYRLQNSYEFLAMGFDDFFYKEGIALIEWSEKIEELLPPHCIRIGLEHMGQEKRKIEIR